MQKLIYACTRGEYGNLSDKDVRYIRMACTHIFEWGEVPVSPYLLYNELITEAVDSLDAEDADRLGLDLLRKCDELWAFGDEMTMMMERDVQEAQRLGIPIRHVDYEAILGTPAKDFAIWVNPSKNSILGNQPGYLFSKGFPRTQCKGGYSPCKKPLTASIPALSLLSLS